MARFATIPAPPSVGDLLGVERITEPSTGFVALDDRLQRGTPGCILVRVPTADMLDAVQAHAARRLIASGLVVVRGQAGSSSPLFRDVAERLGIGVGECDPVRFAERLASGLRAKRAALVAAKPVAGSWDHHVAIELARSDVHMVLVSETSGLDGESSVESYEVARQLDATGRLRWTSALTDEALSALAYDELPSLESWWKRARVAPITGSLPAIDAAATALLARLVFAGRAWPAVAVSALGGDPSAIAALVETGRARFDDGFVVVEADGDAHTDRRTEAELSLVAGALETTFASDPWALIHASALYVGARKVDAARACFERGIVRADGSARKELIAKWLESTTSLGADERAPLLTSAAELALKAGDAEQALRLAQLAASASPTQPELTLLVGQAAMATGDLVTARVALNRARELSNGAAPVLVELGELAYLTGDHEGALRTLEGLDASTDPEVRLAARSIEGKVLLAKRELDAAERHFAEDAWLASVEGLATASRRARLNRAIALMLKGQLGEAGALLEIVRAEGVAAGEAQSQAFALENLCALALRQNEHGRALEYAEQALEIRRTQGDRLRIVRVLYNVAMLRRALGLFDHAEHAILFGRRVLGPGMLSDAAPNFGLVAARVALDRGRADVAMREAERALVEGQTARERDRVLGEAHRLIARAALEDGDVARAKTALQAAKPLSRGADAAWEYAHVTALVHRAEGSLNDELVEQSISLANDEDEFLRESLALAVEHLRAEGRFVEARTQLERAVQLRDRVANRLHGVMRDGFLGRPEVRALERLATELAPTDVSEPEDLAPPTRRTTPPPRTSRELVGEDPAIRALRVAIRRVARSDATVLIRGESGTGQELVAEALHRASERASGPLVTVNCAALVETLLLSELFGHEKGAFTGASARRRGRFELAEGGTLFLDEIGDISPRTQVALLRVLQEKTFERVGGTTAIRANVRIVCATHRDLKAMVERGEFREDLYYRLRGITLEVPALRARLGDLPAIADNLLSRIAIERSEAAKALTPAAVELLRRHRWPGNVRELENALRAASLFADGSAIDARDFTDNVDDLRAASPSSPPSQPRPSLSVVPSVPSLPSVPGPAESGDLEVEALEDDDGTLPAGEAGPTAVAYACVRQGAVSLGDLKRQIERDCVARALAETKGNITRAATLLGMKRPRLSQLVKQYGLSAVSEGSS